MKFRPSSLPALAACPRYVADQQVGEDQKNDGTDRHAALFNLLGGNTAALDELPADDRDGVEWAAEYIRTKAPMSGYLLEREVKREWITPDFDVLTGTPDVTCGPHLFDLKWREDVSDYRAQMAGYVVLMEYGVVDVHILYGLTKRAEVFTLTRDEALDIVGAITQSANSDAPPRACSYCGWCSKRVSCQAVKAEVTKANVAKPANQIETAEEMGAALLTARVVADWCEAVEAAAKEMAFKRGMIPTGFKACEQKGNRKIEEMDKAFGRSGLPQADFLGACNVSFTKLSEAYATFHGLKKVPAERDLETKLGDALKRAPNQQFLKAEKE